MLPLSQLRAKMPFLTEKRVKVMICLSIAFICFVGIPRTISPKVHLRIVDESGNPIKSALIKCDWSIFFGITDRRISDEHQLSSPGEFVIPKERIFCSPIRLFLEGILSFMHPCGGSFKSWIEIHVESEGFHSAHESFLENKYIPTELQITLWKDRPIYALIHKGKWDEVLNIALESPSIINAELFCALIWEYQHSDTNDESKAKIKVIISKLLSIRKSNEVFELKGSSGDYPLQAAAQSAAFPLMEVFLEAGANANILDNNHSSPLHHMSGGYDGADQYEQIQLLLKYGADPCAVNAYGQMPQDIALLFKQNISYKLLSEASKRKMLIDSP